MQKRGIVIVTVNAAKHPLYVKYDPLVIEALPSVCVAFIPP